MINKSIYKLLNEMEPQLDIIDTKKTISKSTNTSIDITILSDNSETKTIALTQYYLHPNGDIIPDPDIVISLFKKEKTAEIQSFQNIYRNESLPPSNNKSDINTNYRVKKELEEYLLNWITNIIIAKKTKLYLIK